MTVNDKTLTSGDSSKNLQAGNDITNINNYGLSTSDVIEIIKTVGKAELLQLFMDNFTVMKNLAKEIADDRAKEITNEFNEKLLAQEEDVILKVHKRLSQPDMQSAFFEAQKGYAKTGDKNKSNLLTDLLINKGKENNGTLKDYLIDEAIEITAKLTSKQLDLLSLLQLRNTANNSVNSIEILKQWIIDIYSPFQDCLPISIQNLEYLEQMNCISIIPHYLTFNSSFLSNFKNSYKGIFASGFTNEEVEDIFSLEKNSILIIPCLNDNSLYQINALNDKDLENMFEVNNVPEDRQSVIKEYFDRVLTDEEIKIKITELAPFMEKIMNISKETNYCRLNPLGTIIALSNIKAKTNKVVAWDFS